MISSSWFLKDDRPEFRESILNIFKESSGPMSSLAGSSSMGDEHDQCQYFFTKAYTMMSERQKHLSDQLLSCSQITEPVVEVRYYRSRIRRSKSKEIPQFIESETGADFALAIQVNLPNFLKVERSILGQCKILHDKPSAMNKSQMYNLLSVGGPESASYMIWGVLLPPVIISAENVACYIESNKSTVLENQLLELGKPVGEFFCDAFLGLWFGKSYNPQKEQETPPKESIGVLHHYLHRGSPPANVVFFGISDSKTQGVPPGIYVTDAVDIPG